MKRATKHKTRHPVARLIRPGLALFGAALILFGGVDVANAAMEASEYRQFLGIDSRRLIWFLAQMHLFFGAFVLGVP
ncbi:MAG: hypothetical protein HOI02_12360, partial [Rhodospirillaceae bacterium]|nr:hypothetical protein [Rhodospirillaceae bacterium]